MPPPLVLLDLDDTLVDRAAAIRRFVTGLVGRRPDAESHVAALLERDRDGRAARSLFLGQTHARLGLPGAVDDLHRHYGERFPSCYDPVAGPVRDALVALRAAGCRLAVVTEGERYQEAVLRRTGLADLVDGWVIAEVDGARKPDVRAFRLAARRVGAELGPDVVMVGDDPLDDIAAARAAGLSTVWVDRGRAWPAELAPPDAVAPDAAAALDGLLGG